MFAFSTCVAVTTALGIFAPARERLIAAGALGEIAGPGCAFCVASFRWAEAEAARAVRLAAGTPRSMLGACPTPAVLVPWSALVSEVRVGAAEGLLVARVLTAREGLAIAEGEAAIFALVTDREGDWPGAALG